nr:beta-hexosaminidase 2 [Tanacetum cinerariifolium]
MRGLESFSQLIWGAPARNGVRIIPEIDMPGHTGSWAEAYPEIVACANMFWWPEGAPWEERLAAEPGTGHLNPLIPKTYEVVKNVFKEVATLFPDTFFHGGADEVVPGCWKADPTIQKYLANNGTLSEILEIFINQTNPYILSQNKTAVYWEDVILDSEIKVNPAILPPETTIMQTWNGGPNNTKRLVSAGYRTIVSSADYYYLDCGHGDFTGNNSAYDQPPGTEQGKGGSWCGPFKSWQLIYNYDITYGLNETEAKLVLGGEVALWSEQANGNVLDARIWPRASAMGEVLWSGNRDETGKKRSGDATDRGILLDTSRHYFGVEDIMRLIGAMGANKINVFHWHITDSQSFPLVLELEPELASKGSYGSGMEYSIEDVKRVVAKNRF